MTQDDQLEAAASEASKDDASQDEMNLDMVKVSIIGINGEWLEDQPTLGEEVRLHVTGYVKQIGQESIEGKEGRVRDFVQIKATGVKRVK